MPGPPDLHETLMAAWRTSNRVTVDLIRHLPRELWDVAIPGVPRRTVRMIAAHIHNARCRWVETLGRQHGIMGPEALLGLGLASGGRVPPSRAYVWRNLSLDVGHVLSYFVAHEAYHRGQIVMVARQRGHRLPRTALDAMWQWKLRA